MVKYKKYRFVRSSCLSSLLAWENYQEAREEATHWSPEHDLGTLAVTRERPTD
jgi:hypothetical protein